MKNKRDIINNQFVTSTDLPVRCDNYIIDEQIKEYLKNKGVVLEAEEYEKFKQETYNLLQIIYKTVTAMRK